MVTAPLLSMLVIPAAYRLLVRHRLRKTGKTNTTLHPNPQGN
jgi:Cu(I)/Ag(I) efflux system membrane protein CusA/SilA